ncbi:MAG: PepSY-like domain-containing protein [Cyclobacteriaceae bacterium]|jgi:hypothetical protein|nr:PepSY-like domain-containing protein [Cyclobacteriaceae bacterium]
MKTLFLILFVGSITYAMAQDVPKSQVPAEVSNAFASKFAKAKDVEWEMEGDLYKVDFEVGSRDHEAWIDKSGTIRKHREELSNRDLPQVISEKVKTEFQEYRIDDAHKVEADGKTLYHIDLDGPGEDREVWFAEDGTIEQGIE